MRQRIYLLIIASFVASCVLSQVRRQKHHNKPRVQNTETEETDMASMLYESMLPNTQKLFIIDSTVVDRNRLSDAIPLPKDYGQILPYDKFFNTKKGTDTYVYVNGFGNKCFYSEMSADSTFRLMTRDRLNDGEWSQPQLLEGFDIPFTEINYPYMTSDGTTLYFAAKSEEGLGGYDIYVTTYDSESGRFLKAENVGLPFNSDKDDMMYVEDDTDGIAWFATTRRQPEGKVCVYTVSLSSTRHNYNGEIDENTLRNYAAITSIKDTWESEESRQKAMARLQKAVARDNKAGTAGTSVSFVINDEVEYTDLSDFSSDKNRSLYLSIRKRQKQLDEESEQTEQMRARYRSATGSERSSLATKILNAEKSGETLRQSIINDMNALRKSEYEQMKK